MKDKTLIAEIDSILEAAYNIFPSGLNRHDIIKTLNKQDTEVTGALIEEIINHLTENGYLKQYEQTVTMPAYAKDAPHWSLTFNGRLFHLEGGYRGKIERANATNTANRNVFRLTCVIAFATLVSGFYYALEIWKYFHPYCCHCH